MKIISGSWPPQQAFDGFISSLTCLVIYFLCLKANLPSDSGTRARPSDLPAGQHRPSPVRTQAGVQAALSWSCNRRIPIFQFLFFFFLTSWVVGAHY